MADKKFDQFTDGEEMQVGDIPVGLRSSNLATNFKFDFPGTGIKDSNGNYLFRYSTAGASAVNYPLLTNSITGQAVIYSAGGTDTNIDLSIQPKGTGQIILDELSWPASAPSSNSSFIYANTDGSMGYSTGSVATSIIGTVDQVLANGTSGTPESGAVTLTTPQNIAPTSSPTFASLTLTSPLTLANGGSSKALVASNGGIVYSDADSLEILAGTATAGQMLRSGSNSAPTWSTATWPTTTTANQLLYSSSADTVTGLTSANSAILYTNASGVPAWSSSLTNGQIMIGSTGASPVPATLTAGSGISISNTAGGVTISAGGGGFSWTEVTGTSQAMAVNNGYIANNAGLVTLTVPATMAVGDSFSIVGKGTGGWKIQANTGQTIYIGSSTSSVAGSLASTNRRDSVEIVCTTANTEVQVVDLIGNITVA